MIYLFVKMRWVASDLIYKDVLYFQSSFSFYHVYMEHEKGRIEITHCTVEIYT